MLLSHTEFRAWRPPYNVDWMHWFLKAHAVPSMETFTDGVYRRTVRLPHGPGAIELHFEADGVRSITHLTDRRDAADAAAAIERILALGTAPGRDDPVAVDDALASDSALRASIRAAPGLRVPGAADPTEVLLRTMIGQQISLGAAATHTARLVESLGDTVEPVGGLSRLFPTAAAVADRGAEVLTGPAKRVTSIIGAAAAIAEGSLDLDPHRPAADVEADLMGLRGIGPWTARYVAMRVLDDSDVLLDTDLVVRQGAALLGLDLTKSARWAPWRSYVSMHLWRVALAARAST